eukprot:s1756_g15.t1
MAQEVSKGEALLAKVGKKRNSDGVRPHEVNPEILPTLPPVRQKDGKEMSYPGLYQVTTGVVPVKGVPHISGQGLGLLKGGHRFFAVPYNINGYEWLRLEKEDVPPPLFAAIDKSKEKLNKLEEMYWKSVPSLVSSKPSLYSEPALWIRNEVKTLTLLRHGRIQRSKTSVDLPKDVLRSMERMQNASASMIRRFKEPLQNRELKDWVRCGGGAWTNFSEYGLFRPPNDNCGRWRQLQDRPLRGNG